MIGCPACDGALGEAVGDRCPHCRVRLTRKATTFGEGGAFRQATYSEVAIGEEDPAPDCFTERRTALGPILRIGQVGKRETGERPRFEVSIARHWLRVCRTSASLSRRVITPSTRWRR